MIGSIRGILLAKQAPHLILDVQGIGYELESPMTTFYHLPSVGETVTLHTHFIVREDAQLLYGFYDTREKTLFRDLIKVNGVGPKLALAILSGIEADDFIRSVHHNDTAQLIRLPGVGKKTAERLIIEMRDKLKDWQNKSAICDSNNADSIRAEDVVFEAESALVSLGYKPQEANNAVKRLHDGKMTSEQLIREVLKSMVKV